MHNYSFNFLIRCVIYSERLARLGANSLDWRRLRLDLILVYKINVCLVAVNFTVPTELNDVGPTKEYS